MKEKIIAAIKAKFPTVNLSKKRLEAIAAKIEAKVIDDETKIDAAITTYDEYNPLVEIAKQDDAIRNLEGKLKTPPKKDEPGVPPVPVITDDTPEWAKAMIEQNKLLAAGLSALQGEKAQSTIRTKATALLSEKGKEVPVSYWGKRPLPEKEEELEAFITEVQTDYTAFKQEMTDAGLSVLPTPKSTSTPAPAGDKTVSPEIKAFAEKQAAAQKSVAATV